MTNVDKNQCVIHPDLADSGISRMPRMDNVDLYAKQEEMDVRVNK